MLQYMFDWGMATQIFSPDEQIVVCLLQLTITHFQRHLQYNVVNFAKQN